MCADISRRCVLTGLTVCGATATPAWAWKTEAPLNLQGDASGRALCALALSPREDRLATGGVDGCVRLWDARTLRLLETRQVSSQEIFTLAWSVDSRRLACGSGAGTVHVLSTADLSQISSADCPDVVTGVGFAQDGTVAASGHGGWLSRIDADDGQVLRNIQVGVSGWAMAVSSDGRFAVLGNPISLIDLTDGAVVAVQASGGRETHDIQLSKVGDLIVSSHWNGEVRLWRPALGHDPLVLRPMVVMRAAGPQNAMPVEAPVPMAGLSLSPDGAFVVVGGADRRLRCWDTRSGVLLATTGAYGRPVSSMVHDRDGARLFTADLGGAVRVWSLTQGRLTEGQSG